MQSSQLSCSYWIESCWKSCFVFLFAEYKKNLVSLARKNDPTVSFSTNHNKEIDLWIWHQDKRISPNCCYWLIQNTTTHLNRWIPKIKQTNRPLLTKNKNHKNTLEMKYKAMHKKHQAYKLSTSLHFYYHHHHRHPQFDWLRPVDMATVTTQASATLFRPCASKSRFLTGSSGKLTRELSIKPMASTSSGSFKVEAKKGEWLPGLPSPTYLDGR